MVKRGARRGSRRVAAESSTAPPVETLTTDPSGVTTNPSAVPLMQTLTRRLAVLSSLARSLPVSLFWVVVLSLSIVFFFPVVVDTPPSPASTPAPVVSFPVPDADAYIPPSPPADVRHANASNSSDSVGGSSAAATAGPRSLWLKQPNAWAQISPKRPRNLNMNVFCAEESPFHCLYWYDNVSGFVPVIQVYRAPQLLPNYSAATHDLSHGNRSLIHDAQACRQYYHRLWKCYEFLAPGPPTFDTPISECCQALEWVEESGTAGGNCLCSMLVRENLFGYPINTSKLVDVKINCTGTIGGMTGSFINMCSTMAFSGDPYANYDGTMEFSAKLTVPGPPPSGSPLARCKRSWNQTFAECSEYIRWALFPPTPPCCDSYLESYKSEALEGPCLAEVLLSNCTSMWSCSWDFWRLCSIEVKCESSATLWAWFYNLGYCFVTKGIPLLPSFWRWLCYALIFAAVVFLIYLTRRGVVSFGHYMKVLKGLLNWKGGGRGG